MQSVINARTCVLLFTNRRSFIFLMNPTIRAKCIMSFRTVRGNLLSPKPWQSTNDKQSLTHSQTGITDRISRWQPQDGYVITEHVLICRGRAMAQWASKMSINYKKIPMIICSIRGILRVLYVTRTTSLKRSEMMRTSPQTREHWFKIEFWILIPILLDEQGSINLEATRPQANQANSDLYWHTIRRGSSVSAAKVAALLLQPSRNWSSPVTLTSQDGLLDSMSRILCLVGSGAPQGA